MEPVQAILIFYSIFVAVTMAIGYYFIKGLAGIYGGWLVATLTAVYIHEALLSYAVQLL